MEVKVFIGCALDFKIKKVTQSSLVLVQGREVNAEDN